MLGPLAVAVIEYLADANSRLTLACAGAGSSAIASLASCPGASKVLVEGRLAYSRAAVEQASNSAVEAEFCSPAMSLDLAHLALRRAREYEPDAGLQLTAVAASGALATSRARRGRDRAYIAAVAVGRTDVYSLELANWPGQRAAQELLTGAALLLAAVPERDRPADLPLPEGLVETLMRVDIAPSYWPQRVLRSVIPFALFDQAGAWSAPPPAPRALLAGSFNPLHDGHRRLAEAAESHLGVAVAFELSMANVEKPELQSDVVVDRVESMAARRTVTVDMAATFAQKAALFPGAVFVVGADTAERIVDPRFYGGSRSTMHTALSSIADCGCSFLVAGRALRRGYVTMADLDLAAAPQLFSMLEESAFRLDVSSTSIRRQGGLE